MTKKEIIEGNKLIALFDGFEFLNDNSEFCPNGYFVMNSEEGHNNMHHPEELNYHKSYDWLMPVFEKIFRLQIGNGIETVDYACCRTFGMLNNETGGIMVRLNGFTVHESQTLIEATYSAVLEFIQFYNQQSK